MQDRDAARLTGGAHPARDSAYMPDHAERIVCGRSCLAALLRLLADESMHRKGFEHDRRDIA